MLRLEQNPTFTHRVEVMVPVDGGHQPSDFDVTFAVISDDDADIYDTTTLAGLKDFLRRIIVSMARIEDDQGNEAPYNDGLRELVIGRAYVRMAILRAYNSAMLKVKAGN